MRIIVDKDKCVGAGQCVLTEPKIFDQDELGIVKLLQERPSGELEAQARRAAYLCPSLAITLIEE